MRGITAELEVAASTTSREIQTHQLRARGKHYCGEHVSHYLTLATRRRARPVRWKTDPVPRGQVVAGLNRR